MRETFETLDFIVPENTPVFAAANGRYNHLC